MRATVVEKREVARGTLLLVFDAGEPFDFRPGQYFWVEVLDPPYTDDRGSRRHISVVLSPTEGGRLGMATRLRDSVVQSSNDCGRTSSGSKEPEPADRLVTGLPRFGHGRHIRQRR